MPVQTGEHVLSLLQKNQPALKKMGVRRCGLFGSFLTHHVRAESDVDILVEFEPTEKRFEHFMQLALFLESLFDRKDELVTPESLSPYIGPHILHEVKYVSFTA